MPLPLPHRTPTRVPAALRHLPNSRPFGRPLKVRTPLGQLVAATGKTMYQVAAVLGMSESSLSNYMSGRHALRGRALQQVCSVMECQPSDIVDDRGYPITFL